MRGLKYPSSKKVGSSDSRFEAVHGEARQTDFTGSLVLRAGVEEGVVVYLDGHPVYAYFTDSSKKFRNDALTAMSSKSGSIERHASTNDKVEMFITYMNFINRDDGIMRIYETEEADIWERTLLLPREDEIQEITVPEGVRLGYALNKKYAREYFEHQRLSGYALSNDRLVFFENGRETETIRLKNDGMSITMRVKSQEALESLECEYVAVFGGDSNQDSRIEVRYDIEGWEIVDTNREIQKDKGLLGRLFG